MEDKELHNLQRRLRETRELAERNNEILQKIYRSILWSRVGWIFYWVVLTGIAVGAFYFLEPYWDTVVETYESVQGQFQGLSSPSE